MGNFFLGELSGYPGVNNLIVILMGLGVVFAGLIGLIIVCSIMGKICASVIKEAPQTPAATPAPVAASAANDIPDRGSFIAAVSAAIAEASGTDAAGIRIVKIEKK